MQVHLESLEDLRFHEVPDAGFRHDRDGDGLLDFANDREARHARDATLSADVGGHALERHHGARAGLFGDLRLFGVDDVHDDAALELFAEADLADDFLRREAGNLRKRMLTGHDGSESNGESAVRRRTALLARGVIVDAGRCATGALLVSG